MRSAIRGDFERLAERRGGQELMRESSEDPEHASAGEAPTHEREPEPEPAPEPDESGGPEDSAGSEDSPESEPRERSWVDRLLGR